LRGHLTQGATNFSEKAEQFYEPNSITSIRLSLRRTLVPSVILFSNDAGSEFKKNDLSLKLNSKLLG